MSKKVWYKGEDFSLWGTCGKTGVVMLLQSDKFFSTSQLPWTHEVLKSELPSIFSSNCFNDRGYLFCEEVKNTELGHLFEHILLEYLCQAKIQSGAISATYKGRTSWNWPDYPPEIFRIYVNLGQEDRIFLVRALAKTILLMRLICNMGDQLRSPIFDELFRRV